jgi:hypothetical protein
LEKSQRRLPFGLRRKIVGRSARKLMERNKKEQYLCAVIQIFGFKFKIGIFAPKYSTVFKELVPPPEGQFISKANGLIF